MDRDCKGRRGESAFPTAAVAGEGSRTGDGGRREEAREGVGMLCAVRVGDVVDMRGNV